MKYSATIALFIGAAAASNDAPCTCQDESATFFAGDRQFETEAPKQGGLFGSLTGIADNFLSSANEDDSKLQSEYHSLGASEEFLGEDSRQNDMLCIKEDLASKYGNQYLILDDATRVNANYESCHVGETIIPAIKEQTNVKQAACYSSDSAAKYNLKGFANNNYKLSGSLTQSDCTTEKATSTSSSGLVLKGNKNKKFCQSGNEAVGGCADGSACGYGLDGTLLDGEALDVTANPAERVDEEVESVIRAAISKTISDAVSYCLESSLKSTVQI